MTDVLVHEEVVDELEDDDTPTIVTEPVRYRGMRSPVWGPILAVLGIVALVFYNKVMTGEKMGGETLHPLHPAWSWLVAVLAAVAILTWVFAGFGESTARSSRTIGMATLLTVVLAAVATYLVHYPYSTPESSKKAATTSSKVDTGSGDWSYHLFREDQGVPTGYFGNPICSPEGDAKKCIELIKADLKRDPEILSEMMRNLYLLDDYFGKSEKEVYGQSDEVIEKLRQQAALDLKDVNKRKEWQPKVAAVLDSMKDPSIERLTGDYYSVYTDANGGHHQIKKPMDPSKNYALTGTLPDGRKPELKLDCHIQPVSKQPLPNVPNKTPPTPTPPPVCTNCVPTEHGKDHRLSTLNNPNVPDQPKGCGTSGCGTPTTQTPEPASTHTDEGAGDTGCGGPCPRPSNIPPQPTDPPSDEKPPTSPPTQGDPTPPPA